MASKIDKVLDRLERLTNDVNTLKRRVVASPIVPLPPKVKGALGSILETSDNLITDAYFGLARDVADVVLPANVAMEVINNPNVLMDSNGAISQITPRPGRPGIPSSLMMAPEVKKPRKVTKKMRAQRKIQSTAFKNANARGRKKDGTFRSGYDQSRIARMAQKECTKERQRLGLCEKPKRRSKKKK
tara:strand:+ start:789 stop:1349 length:561 start_codon:yes stop_codon:yes gene_type:complete